MWWLIFFVVIGLLIWIGVYGAMDLEKRQENARHQYHMCLSSLKKEPDNADLRQRTLAMGRIYSFLLRDAKGNTLFDEIALMNDITAACAATQQVVVAPIASDDLAGRLRKLQDLKAKGLIDDADYIKRKNEIIAQI